MKKIMLATLIGLFSLAANAQTKETDNEKKAPKPNVPAVVTQAFAKEFPNTKASWDAEDGDFEAELSGLSSLSL